MTSPGCSGLNQGLFGPVPATLPTKVHLLWVLVPCGLAAVTGLLAVRAGEVVGVAPVVVLTSSVLTMLLLVLKCTGGTVWTTEVGKAEIASKIQSLSFVTRV